MKAPDIPLWNGPPPPAGRLQMAERSLEIVFDKEEPPGSYRIRSKVRDQGARRRVELSLPLEFVAGRP